ncbi:MAG: SRPBCC family protein [Halobacteriales archaeon]|nr:SRPBCC family protein [Halobacteriales archaeon]
MNPMVRYYSDDGVFDAPVQKVWKLIEAHQDPANKIHAGLVSVTPHPQPDGTAKLDVVTKGPDGKTMNHKWHVVVKPPFTQTVEFIDGPMKGSWMTTTYLPEGNRTRCITVAEWRIQGVTDEKALHKAANEFFDNGFDEDQRFLKTLK